MQGQQAQRIADERGHPAVLSSKSVKKNIEDQEAEESFRLAAARCEVKKAGGQLVAIGIEPIRKRWHAGGEGRHMREDEGELEQSPIGKAFAAVKRERFVGEKPSLPWGRAGVEGGPRSESCPGSQGLGDGSGIE